MRVGVLGWGAIGSAVGRALLAGAVDGATLAAVGSRRLIPDLSVPVVAPSDLGRLCDVVVEAAGHGAVRDHVPHLLQDGCDVLVVSTGALCDEAVVAALGDRRTGRLLLSSGAVGGIDLIRACGMGGAIRSIRLTSTKPPSTLRQDWMDDSMAASLDRGDEHVVCFDGPAAEAVRRFPKNVNVAATLALAAGSWDLVHVAVVADPVSSGNRHHIVIDADVGHYEVDIANEVLPDNPRSSALVVASVLRGIDALVAEHWEFV